MTESIQFYDPSPVGGFYEAHMRLMKPIAELPENKVFIIDKMPVGDAQEEMSLFIFRRIAKRFSVGKKAFVVIDHPGQFEVRRLTDNDSAEDFYKFAEPEKALQNSEQEAFLKVLNIIRTYKTASLKYVQTYEKTCTEKMKADNIFTSSYVSRKVSSISCFRKSSSTVSEILTACFEKLQIDGVIIEVPSGVSTNKYNTSAKCYQILKGE